MVECNPILKMRELGGHGIGAWNGCGQSNVVKWLGWHVAGSRNNWWTCEQYVEMFILIYVHGVGVEDSGAIVVAYLSDGEKGSRGKFWERMGFCGA